MTDTLTPPTRDDLKTAIATIAKEQPDVLEQLAAKWPKGMPTLKGDHQHTVAERTAIAELLDEVAADPFNQPPPPPPAPLPEEPPAAPAQRPATRGAAIASLEDLRTRAAALPPDLYASLEEQMPVRPGGTRIEDVTIDEVQHAVTILDAAEQVAAVRLRRVHAGLQAAGLDDDDEHRHAIINQLTAGRTQSSKALTDAEAEHVVDAAAKIETDLAVLGYLEDGTPHLVDRDGFPLPPAPAPDWRALAKEWGVKLGDLLRQAAELATLCRVDLPKKVDQIEGHVGYRLLARHALEGSTVAAEQASPPAPAAAAPQDPPPAAAVAPAPPSSTPPEDGGAGAPSVLVVIHRPGGGLDVITTTAELAAEATSILKGAA